MPAGAASRRAVLTPTSTRSFAGQNLDQIHLSENSDCLAFPIHNNRDLAPLENAGELPGAGVQLNRRDLPNHDLGDRGRVLSTAVNQQRQDIRLGEDIVITARVGVARTRSPILPTSQSTSKKPCWRIQRSSRNLVM